MKAPVLITLLAAIVMTCIGWAGAQTPDASPEPAGAAIHLFNGKDLSGFYSYIRDRGRDTDPKGVFSVNDGILRISGEEWGCLTTDEEYENYHLTVEFRWGEATHANRVNSARDSGVLLHSVGEDAAFGNVWMYSIECQLIEGGTGDFIVVGDGSEQYAVTCPVGKEKHGASPVFDADGEPTTINSGRINWWGRDPEWKDVKGFRGAKDVEKPVGEWNTLECIAQGPEITVILNGVVVNKAIDAKPSKGRIQIQSEGAEIFFRKVDLTPLKPQTSP